jgi:ubiquitin carboxyl-terminal hydrolase 22/27/51
VYPQGEEDKFVLPHSNALSCQAGAPRGIYNLGNTCYLSVILQAMIHNPLMRNYFLSSRHDTADCKMENCIACALTNSFTDILATEKIDGHGPVEMLYKSWLANNVSEQSSLIHKATMLTSAIKGLIRLSAAGRS